MIEDSKIIDLFYARSEQAIVELSAKYGAVCKRVALNILKNEPDAEECVNDACHAAWNTIPPQKPHPLCTYICRIVRNIAIAKYHANTSIKRNSFYDVALDELENCLVSPGTVEKETDTKELAGLLDRFLDTLDKESRVLFVRRYWYGDSLTDIGASFQISSNNAAVRLSRIRKRLKKYLKKEGFDI